MSVPCTDLCASQCTGLSAVVASDHLEFFCASIHATCMLFFHSQLGCHTKKKAIEREAFLGNHVLAVSHFTLDTKKAKFNTQRHCWQNVVVVLVQQRFIIDNDNHSTALKEGGRYTHVRSSLRRWHVACIRGKPKRTEASGESPFYNLTLLSNSILVFQHVLNDNLERLNMFKGREQIEAS